MTDIEKIQKYFYGTYLILASILWLSNSVYFILNNFFPSSFYASAVLFLIQFFSFISLFMFNFSIIRQFLSIYTIACTLLLFPNLITDISEHRSETLLFQITNGFCLMITYQDKRLVYWIIFIIVQTVTALTIGLTVKADIIHSLLINSENTFFYFSFDFYRWYTIFIILASLIYLSVGVFIARFLTAQKELWNSIPEKKIRSDANMYFQLYEQIVRYFDEQKPYTNPNFKIGELATRLKTNPHYIAQAIKQNRQMNFSTFVNLYRINLAKQLLGSEERKKYTMQYVQVASGFQTQPTFNHVFKKMTGFSPLEYETHFSTLNILNN